MGRDTWNIRIKPEIKEYYKINNINPREVLEQKYYEMKKNQLPELRKEKERLQMLVAQIDITVAQLEHENELKNKEIQIFNEKKAENEIKNTLQNASFPEYYINKTIAGKKITRKIFNKYVKE